MEPWKLTGLIALAILTPPILSYNRFIRQRALIRNAWSNIDTELRRRWDLIPNLVEAVKGYAAHERAVLHEVTSARAAAQSEHGGAAAHAAKEGALARSLRQLLALAESYPDLKASRNFLDLQHELAITEDRIQTARRFYNANVAGYNTRVRAFPSMLISMVFGFAEEDFFEVEAAIRDAGAPSTSTA